MNSSITRSVCIVLLPVVLSGMARCQVQHTPPATQAPPYVPVPTVIVTVDPSGGGNYTTIKAAVNSVPSGAYIRVLPGTYTEYGIDFGYKELNLQSVGGAGLAIVDGTSTPSPTGSIFLLQHFQTGASIINGFTLKNGRSDRGGAIYCLGTSPTIINNTIDGNSAAYGGGIYVENGAPLIAGNTISNNGKGQASGSYGQDAVEGGGLNLQICASNVHNNNIFGNRAGGVGGGIALVYGSNITLTENHIDNNIADGIGGVGNGGGISVFRQAAVTSKINFFTYNTAKTSGGGAYIASSSSNPISFDSDTFSRNEAQYQDGGGADCEASSPTFINDTFEYNLCDRRGGGVSCNGAGAPVFYGDHVRKNAAYNNGGGISCTFDANAKISRCDITDNDIIYPYGTVSGAFGTGGGIYAESASLTIRRNTIKGNGRATSTLSSSLCGRGGGMDIRGGTYSPPLEIIEANQIVENEVGFNGGGAGVALRNLVPASVFSSNVVGLNKSVVGVCTGAGILIEEDGTNPLAGSFRFYNNTIAINKNGTGSSAFDIGGGIVLSGLSTAFFVDNCIIWGNVANGDTVIRNLLPQAGVPLPSVNYSDVSAAPVAPANWAYPGVHMLSMDPQFFDLIGNFHIKNNAGQVLKDYGNNGVVNPMDIDMDGAPRITNAGAGGIVDIGADEI